VRRLLHLRGRDARRPPGLGPRHDLQRRHAVLGRDTGEGFEAAPDIDHLNERVQRELSAWLNWLKSDDVGFDGWRLEFAKGYSPAVAKMYVNTGPSFVVTEIWNSVSYTGSSAGRRRRRRYGWMRAISLCIFLRTEEADLPSGERRGKDMKNS
jgi:alpha-amylase